MNIVFRPIVDSEYAEFCQRVARGFGEDASDDDAASISALVEPSRTVCAFDGQRMIGTSAAFALELAVPGATLPMAGTTLVTVEQTHRRRGVLRAMMRKHLDDVRTRGEPLAGLWASEGAIYPRFGYGHAAEGQAVKLDGAITHFNGEANTASVRMIEADEASALLPLVYEQIWPHRPGMLNRNETWWRTRILLDRPQDRDGSSAYRYVVCESENQPLGYVIFRQQSSEETFGRGQVRVSECMALTGPVHELLWRYLCRIDLFPLVSYWNAPPDDELKWRVTDAYRVRRRSIDNLWLRLMDVPVALSTRHYADSGSLTLEVNDGFGGYAAGRYRLDAHPDGSECHATSATADLKLDAAALGSLYLGRRCVFELHRTGLIDGDERTIQKADRLFSWYREPWCAEVF